MRTTPRLAGAAALLALTLAACGSGDSSSSSEASCTKADEPAVDVVDNAFEPETLCVKPGTEVTWTWTGKQPHNVVGEGVTSELQKEGTFTHTFPARGTFEYRCTVHAGMNGKVVVF